MEAMKPPRLAYLIHTFPLFSLTFVVDEIAAMRCLGASIALYGVRKPGRDEYPENYQHYCDETHYVLPIKLFRHGLAHLKWLFSHTARYFSCLRFIVAAPGCGWRQRFKLLGYLCEAVALAERITPARYDHLHVHFLFGGALIALFLNKLTGIRYSATAHGSDFLVDRWLLAEKIHHADFVRVGTRFNAKYIADRIDQADRDKLFVLPFGIDHQGLIGERQAIICKITQRNALPPKIINVGRMVWQKNQTALIDAAHILATRGIDFSLEIIGEGELRAEIEALIVHHGLQSHVVLRGALPRNEVLTAMRAADIFALSSVSEGFGIVLLEAMLCGLAVVAPEITGVAEIVSDSQTGRLYRPQHASALADCLEQMIVDETLRRRYQLGAFNDVLARFDHHEKVAQLYQRMVLRQQTS